MRISRKALKALAAFLVLSFAQVGVQVSYAAENSEAAVLPIPQQLVIARVDRLRGTALTINGNGVTTGATITTASMIETGPDTAVTINLGSLGTLDIAPNTRLELTYDDNGVKIRVLVGCAVLRTKKNKDGEATTEKNESAGKTSGGGILDICVPSNGNPVVNQGAAAAALASLVVPVSGGGALWGIGGAAVAAIFGGAGAAIILPLVLTQSNNSGSTPS